MNEFTKIILDLVSGERRFYDISGTSRIGLISQHIPVYRVFHESIVKPLFNTKVGDTVIIKAFLKFSDLKFSLKKLIDFDNTFGVNLKNGYNAYEIVSVGGIPTYCLVLSSIANQPSIEFPIEMELERIGEINGKIIFYLKDWKTTILDIFGVEAPEPNLNLMRKSILDVLPSLSRSKEDLHVVDSILAPYVGSDTLKHGIDGVGASYVGDNIEGLKTIHGYVTEPSILPSVRSFGVINFLDNRTINQIEEMRMKNSVLKTISWNLKSDQELNNLKLSEFKYMTDAPLEVLKTKDLENNYDFQQSLILLTTRNKVISQRLFGNVFNIASKEITSWLDKGEKNLIDRILDANRIEKMVARLASFHLAFQPDEEKVIYEIKDTISSNTGDIIKKFHEIGLPNTKDNRGLELEKKLDSRIITALYTTNGSQEEIIGALIDMGYTEKRANEIFKYLEESGLIVSEDGGKHYKWTKDYQLKFRQ